MSTSAEIQAGDDLTLLTRSNQHGSIMHALQPEVVQEIIARFAKRWWNTRSSKVAANVVRIANFATPSLS